MAYPTLTVRVSEEVKTKFVETSERYGGTSHVLRELVVAFIENRVEIAPPKNPLYTFKGE